MRIGICAGALVLLLMQIGVSAGENIEIAIATLERQESEIGAYEVVFVINDKTVWGATPTQVQVSRLENRQFFDGGRRRLECTGLMNVAQPKDLCDQVTVVSEGKHRSLDRAARLGQIGGEAEFPPDYVSGAYLFTEGLLGWLKAHKSGLSCVSESVGGVEHLKCVWVEERSHIHVWLNPQKRFQLAQLEVFSRYQPGVYADTRKQGTYRVVVSDYWESDRATLPSKVRTTYEVEWPDGRREIFGDKTLVVSSVTANKVFAPEDFSVNFPNGFAVTDVDRQVYYVQGDPKSERRLGQPVDSTPVGPDGVRVGRSSWVGSWLWVVGGLGLVAVAGVLKFRAARE